MTSLAMAAGQPTPKPTGPRGSPETKCSNHLFLAQFVAFNA